jgi:hypothetical protein
MRSGKELQFSHSQTSAGPFSFYHLIRAQDHV